MINRKRTWFMLLLAALCFVFTVHGAQCPHEFETHFVEGSCESTGIAYDECILCGLQCNYRTTPALGHEFGEWYVVKEPTCTKEGTKARDCVRCGDVETASIDHLGHNYTVYVVEPTCTARGYTQHYCEGCGDRYRTDYVDATGHHYDDGVVTKKPTLTAMGRITYTCQGCGDTYQETIPQLKNPFVDVSEDAYYFEAVLWAANNGIIVGVDETHFAPDQRCTRAQVVTLLWRTAGKPDVDGTACPFVDVAENQYYHHAVVWAYQQGIVSGVDSTHFDPDGACTRAHVVALLYRFAGCPEYRMTSTFPDVTESAYYYDAVCWALEENITVGYTDGRFMPNQSCNRAQAATFLYRAQNPDWSGT